MKCLLMESRYNLVIRGRRWYTTVRPNYCGLKWPFSTLLIDLDCVEVN